MSTSQDSRAKRRSKGSVVIAITLFLMHCAAWAGAWLSLWL